MAIIGTQQLQQSQPQNLSGWVDDGYGGYYWQPDPVDQAAIDAQAAADAAYAIDNAQYAADAQAAVDAQAVADAQAAADAAYAIDNAQYAADAQAAADAAAIEADRQAMLDAEAANNQAAQQAEFDRQVAAEQVKAAQGSTYAGGGATPSQMMTPSYPNAPIRVQTVPPVITANGTTNPDKTYQDIAGQVWKYLKSPVPGPGGAVQYKRVPAAAPSAGVFASLSGSLKNAPPLLIGAGVVALALAFSKGNK